MSEAIGETTLFGVWEDEDTDVAVEFGGMEPEECEADGEEPEPP